MKTLTCAAFLSALVLPLSLSPAQAQQKPVLTVLTYDSFAADWGSGPVIKAAFEKDCGCELRFLPGGDGAAVLSRLRMEGARSEADVVLGLDTALTAQAAATGLFVPHGQPPAPDLPIAYEDPLFLPFDWGWFAFNYDKNRLSTPPASFTELAASDLKVVIQDPRSSTPGLGLLLWVKAAYGAQSAELWRDLADNILTVTPGWSEAYDLFLKGEADMVLSYSTSPAYHLLAEKDDSKAAAGFAEGHYLQIEVAGQLKAAREPELAARFMAFIHSDAFQAAIPQTNWMYPAKLPASGAEPGFAGLIAPQKSLLFSAEEAQDLRAEAVEEWRAALSQ